MSNFGRLSSARGASLRVMLTAHQERSKRGECLGQQGRGEHSQGLILSFGKVFKIRIVNFLMLVIYDKILKITTFP